MSRGGSTSSNKGSGGITTTDTYYICKVQDASGKITFEPIPTTGYTARLKELNDAFLKAYNEWKSARDEAGTAASVVTPKQPRIDKLGQQKGRAIAENTAAALQARWNAARKDSTGDKPPAEK